MKRCILILPLIILSLNIFAQELFPHNEPASSVPKNVLGIRLFGETYDENGTQRNMFALRAMYGLTSKLTVMVTGTVSNHHSDSLPPDLITHKHNGSQTIYYAQNYQKGVEYSYRFNGIHLYSKYRFLSSDGQNQHFRMSVYGEWSNITSAHDEAEPNLLDDTRGYGAGIIMTYLKKHFAASLTTGVIIPGDYNETTIENNGGELNTQIQYGRALKYNLSFGYLIYPSKYKSYDEINICGYLELLGKTYETAKITQNNTDIKPETEFLTGNNYLEVHPGLQAIIKSNLRIEFTVGFPLIRKSYTHFYPIYMIGFQRYFF